MSVSKTYKFASSTLGINVPKELACDTVFGQYSPFEEACEHPDITLKVEYYSDFLALRTSYEFTRFNEEAPYLWLSLQNSGEGMKVVAGFSNNKMAPQGLYFPSYDFSTGTIYLPLGADAKLASFVISNAAMIAYSYITSKRQTLLIHASAVVKDGRAYVFLGRSGTGKSTHARLWLENIPESKLLNDDNPIIYIKQGKVYVCGSPWSGKTPCYIREEYPLAGIVRLHQAPENKIIPIRSLKAYAAFLPSCSCMKWDRQQSNLIGDTVADVLEKVPVWQLDCLPDATAARLCFETISKT